MRNDEPFYSFHCFLFPFEWEYKNMENHSFELKTNVERFHQLLNSPGSRWQRDNHWIPPAYKTAYNETAYFYDFVHGILYDSGKEDAQLRHYRFKLNDKNYYIINCRGREYHLETDEILLHLYNTGVGVISFHLYNRDYTQASPDDILNINQFGRRIRPPFFGTDTSLIGTQNFFRDNDWLSGLKSVKNSALADSIILRFADFPQIKEEFLPVSIPPAYNQLPLHIRGLFPDAVFNEINMSESLDDRMFTLCWYGNKELCETLKKKIAFSENQLAATIYEYQKNDWWYKYVFADAGNDPSCQNDKMKFDLLTDHTNARWVDFGTLYGVSRYSFVALTGSHSDYSMNSVIASHVQSMYYKMAELCLVQRACVLRFSDEITEISALDNNEKRNLSDLVSSLYKQYIRFINKIYFREITAQEQGIELYDLLQKHMRLGRDVNDLDREMHELHEYVSLAEEKASSRLLNYISVLGAVFVAPTFLVGYFGSNLAPVNAKKLFIACIAIAVLSLLALKTRDKYKINWLFYLAAIALLLITGFILGKYIAV